MHKNVTFKGMQNENAELKQDYRSLMKEYVKTCRSLRKSYKVNQELVEEFLMPKLKSNIQTETVRHLSDSFLNFYKVLSLIKVLVISQLQFGQ